jgi:hypothetical protein
MKTCPSCSKELPDYATKCKYCDHSFVEEPAAASPSASPQSASTRLCPNCSKEIPIYAEKCSYCDFDFSGAPVAPKKPQKSYASCVLPIAILVAIVIGAIILTKQNAGQQTTPRPDPTKTTGTRSNISVIPGLSPSDIKVNLEDRGFTCTDASSVTESDGQKSYLWYCDRKEDLLEYHVDFSSKSLGEVEYLDASILQFSTPLLEISSPFLEYMATSAFLNSPTLQVEAKNWVSKSLESKKDSEHVATTINGVDLELFGTSSALMITIQKSK